VWHFDVPLDFYAEIGDSGDLFIYSPYYKEIPSFLARVTCGQDEFRLAAYMIIETGARNQGLLIDSSIGYLVGPLSPYSRHTYEGATLSYVVSYKTPSDWGASVHDRRWDVLLQGVDPADPSKFVDIIIYTDGYDDSSSLLHIIQSVAQMKLGGSS